MGRDYDDTFMNENEKEFFENYSSALEQQEIIIAEQHEMQVSDKEFEALIRDLEIFKGEYIVEGLYWSVRKGYQKVEK